MLDLFDPYLVSPSVSRDPSSSASTTVSFYDGVSYRKHKYVGPPQDTRLEYEFST